MAGPLLDISYCCRPCLRCLRSQSRAFTTTTSRRKHGPLPTFHPTPSPELDTLLTTFRTNIFLPSHLIDLQRTLLYRKKNQSLLTSDEPATVRLGTEIHQLHPLDHKRDEPPTAPSIAKVTHLMSETNDWRNLAAWLEGLKVAGRKVRGWQMEKMVRRIGEGGRVGVVVDCLRRVEGTGMGLWNLRVARECVWVGVAKCVQEGWSREGVERAARYVDTVWEMMSDDRHTGQMTRETDPKRRVEVVGVLVLVHAARVVLFGEGEVARAATEKYTQMMLKLWDSKELKLEEEEDWNTANYKLLMWAPIWRGMTLAQKILGPSSPLGKQLDSKLSAEVVPLLQKSQAILSAHTPSGGGGRGEAKTRRGAKMYDDLSQVSV